MTDTGKEKAGTGWAGLSDGEARGVYYLQLNRTVGLMHTAEQRS